MSSLRVRRAHHKYKLCKRLQFQSRRDTFILECLISAERRLIMRIQSEKKKYLLKTAISLQFSNGCTTFNGMHLNLFFANLKPKKKYHSVIKRRRATQPGAARA